MIKLSKHTADEMEGRGILFSYIEAALASPDRVVQDATDPALSRSYKIIPEFGSRVLRVVHRPDGNDSFVVTTHYLQALSTSSMNRSILLCLKPSHR